MGRRKKRRLEPIENLLIENIEMQGKGVARHEGKVIFVEDVLPGEVVDVKIVDRKKGFEIGKPIHFHKKSDLRQDAFCSHFGLCGGCKWQSISYSEQLKYKHQFVEESFIRIGKLDFPEIKPVLGSEKTQYYRNKLEFSFSDKKWLTNEQIESGEDLNRDGLGFHIKGHFDKVLEIEHCYLQPEPSNKIRLAIKKYALDNNLDFHNIKAHTGLLRNVFVRNSNNNEWMVLMCFSQNDEKNIEGLMGHLKTTFPEIDSLNYLVNTSKNDTIFAHDIVNYSGQPFITETLGDINFKIGPKSFYQTNSQQAKTLYDVAMEFANLQADDVLLDLFTGIGSIALYAAKHCKEVYGIEIVPEAIEDAKENAALNNITNCHFFDGDIRKVFKAGYFNEHPKPDIIITDPPRAGMHPDVVKTLLELETPRIVYVSCNPATQARDLNLLAEKYEITQVQPVDMFPQTYHIENVVALELK